MATVVKVFSGSTEDGEEGSSFWEWVAPLSEVEILSQPWKALGWKTGWVLVPCRLSCSEEEQVRSFNPQGGEGGP